MQTYKIRICSRFQLDFFRIILQKYENIAEKGASVSFHM